MLPAIDVITFSLTYRRQGTTRTDQEANRAEIRLDYLQFLELEVFCVLAKAGKISGEKNPPRTIVYENSKTKPAFRFLQRQYLAWLLA